MSDSYSVILDKATIDLIDHWRHRSLLQPSRRAATRALVRMGLRAQAKAAAPKAPAPEQPAVS
jgi:hypothetical protein